MGLDGDVDTADYATLADQCRDLIGALESDLLYSLETKKSTAFVYVTKPDSLNFISIIEIGPKGGLVGRFITYDERMPTWDRVRIFKGCYGDSVGPLNIPSIKAGNRPESVRAARSAIEELKSRFDSQELDEPSVLKICEFCVNEVRGDSIRGLIGGKCSPS